MNIEELCLDALRFHSSPFLVDLGGDPFPSSGAPSEEAKDLHYSQPSTSTADDVDYEDPLMVNRSARFKPFPPTEIPPLSELVREDFLVLPDGRQLHFQECGNLKHGHATFLFHGALGVGDFSHHAPDFYSLNLRCICPTLPGWGESSSRPDRMLLDWPLDVLELANHLMIPAHQYFDVIGISLGAVHAIACAIVLPDRVRKTLCVSGHAPFGDDSFDPLEHMDFFNSMGLSALSASIPLIGKFGAWWVQKQAEENPRGFIREYLLGQMVPEDKQEFDSFPLEKQAQLELLLVRGFVRSVKNHKTGYVELPRLLRSWSPRDLLRIPERGASVMIVGAKSDTVVPHSHAEYYARRLPAASFVTIPGGHMMGVFYLSNLIRRFVEWSPSNPRATDKLALRTHKPVFTNQFELDSPQLPDEGEYVPEQHSKPIVSSEIEKPSLPHPPDHLHPQLIKPLPPPASDALLNPPLQEEAPKLPISYPKPPRESSDPM